MIRTISLLVIFLFYTALPSCREAPVKNLGVFAPSRLSSVTGQDGVSSIPFSDELWLWTFGDTIIKNQDATETMLSNSLAFTPSPERHTIRDLPFTYHKENGRILQFIKNTPEEDPKRHRLWALDGVRIGNTVYVYYLHIIVHSEKAFDFSLQSVGIARWDVPHAWRIGDPVNFIRQENLFPGKGPAFGSSVLRKNGYLYITGQHNAGNMLSPIQIARVEEDSIARHDAYLYLSGDGQWTKHPEDACGFMGDVAGECSLSYNVYTGKYILIYCRLFSRDIIMVTFNNFTEIGNAKKNVLYSMPEQDPSSKNKLWYYSGKEIFSDRGSIFMIYIDPADYQPHLLGTYLPDLIKKS